MELRKERENEGRRCEKKVQIFVIVTNVFVSVPNPIVIFVLIGHIDDTNNVP